MRRRHVLATAGAILTAPFVGHAQSRDVLKIVPEGDLPILDPVFTTATVVRNHGYMVWDTMCGMDAEYQMQPQMLAGHSIEDDGKRWILTLRPGLLFHDGSPVLARDCVAIQLRAWIDVPYIPLGSQYQPNAGGGAESPFPRAYAHPNMLTSDHEMLEVAMPSYDFVTVDVFTSERFGGNPLAVLPNAHGLSAGDMQSIAAEFNLSETAFVLPPDNPQNHARVRIFTPACELPFAGHPNVGTGFVLARADPNPPEHYTFEEIAGLVRVHILRDDRKSISGARISAPHSLTITTAIPTDAVAACVGLTENDFLTNAHTPLVASVGTKFVIAEVASLEALARAQPDIAAFRAVAARFPGMELRFALHLYVRKDGDATKLRTRMFAPLGGVQEDPATGSANAALSALLVSLAPGEDVALHFEIEQGVEMGRPSLLIGGARKTAEGAVLATVAGSCVPVMRGTLEV